MVIGIFVAIKDEADIIARKLGLTIHIDQNIFHTYMNHTHTIIMMTGGINKDYSDEQNMPIGRPGKVTAGIISTLLLNTYHPDILINAGTAAGVESKGIAVGDVVLGDFVTNHDIDIPLEGYREYGLRKIPVSNNECMPLIEGKYIHGTISSSESFTTSENQWDNLKQNNVSVIDMEAAGVMQTVEILQYKKPVIILKSITGLIDEQKMADDSVASDYITNFALAMNNLSNFLYTIIHGFINK